MDDEPLAADTDRHDLEDIPLSQYRYPHDWQVVTDDPEDTYTWRCARCNRSIRTAEPDEDNNCPHPPHEPPPVP